MMRPSVQGVDPPVCCVLDVTVTYARDSFVDCQAGPFVLSRGAQVSWMLLLHMQETVLWIHRLGLLSSRGGGGPDILAPVLQFLPLALFWATYRVPCSVISVVVRWYTVLRMTFCTRSIVSIKACVPCS